MSTNLTAAEYMALSNVAYANFLNVPKENGGDIGKMVTEMTGDLENDTTGTIRIDSKDAVNTPLQAIGNDWKLIACQNNNSGSGFCGAAFQNANGEIVFALRGTDSLSDIDDDIQLAISGQQLGEANQFRDADAFVTVTLQQANLSVEQRANIKDYVSFTGHSLGGALSEYETEGIAKLVF